MIGTSFYSQFRSISRKFYAGQKLETSLNTDTLLQSLGYSEDTNVLSQLIPNRPSMQRSALFLSFLLYIASGVVYAQSKVVERIATPFIEASKAVELELVIYKPKGQGPFSTVVFNHGSTGRGANPAEFRKTYAPEYVANFFTARGWMVVFPQRRGRGNSDGTYAEGLRTDGAGYSCDPTISLQGLERALADVDVVLNAVAKRYDVNRTRIIMAGVSRGGILSLASAAQHPTKLIAAINFVGGWMNDACPEIDAINLRTFRQAAEFKRPTLWLYGTQDTFYSIEHSRKSFEAFRSAGGIGTFHAIAVGGYWGHYLLDSLDLWSNQMSFFLDSLP